MAGLTVLAVTLLSACGDESEPTADSDSPNGSTSDSPSGSDSAACSYPDAGPAAREVAKPDATPDAKVANTATIGLSAGDVTVTLTPERTPCTVNNFLSLAGQGWYDDTQCHRLTTAGIFVLQCGDPTATGTGGPGYTIPDEVDGSETYPAGTVAMAKTSAPNSGGSQFFLVYDESPLPPDYTVFGTVDSAGLDVLRTIASAGVSGGGSDGQPASPVTIDEVTTG